MKVTLLSKVSGVLNLAQSVSNIARAKEQPQQYEAIVELVTRVVSYIFTDRSPQEIDQMLDIQFEETRVYKDTFAKGNLSMVLNQLEQNCGQLSMELVREVTALPIVQLEALGKALLKFKKVKDLEKWLRENASEA